MKHDCCKIATSAGVGVAVAYTICALFVHMQPEVMLNLLAQFMHLNSTEPLLHYLPYLQLTAANYVSGVAQAFSYAFGIVWLCCQAHHRLFNK